MLSPIVRDAQTHSCWKRGSGDGQRLCLYDCGTTERSFNAVERWGSTLIWTVSTGADSEERQTCQYDVLIRGGRWVVKRRWSYSFSHCGAHLCLRGGLGEERRFWRAIPQWNTKDQLPKPQTATVSTAQWPKWSSTYPNNPGERTASTEQISKKGIKLILKTIGNRKGDCAWRCSRWQTQPEEICKLQSTN